MIDDFINRTLYFLINENQNDKTNSFYPTIHPVDLEPDGTPNLKMEFFTSFAPQSKTTIDIDIVRFMMFFMLLDIFVDTLIPEDCIGASFSKRYRKLPSNTDSEIMLRQVYRIMKIFRNAISHSRSINILNNQYSIDYCNHNTCFRLDIEREKIELLYFLIRIFVSLRNNVNSYILSFLRNYYDSIISSITCFNDEYGSNLSSISHEDLRIKKLIRKRVQNPKCQIIDTKLKVDKLKIHDEKEKGYTGAEYLIQIDNIPYIIPDELLDESGWVEISKIDEWKYDENIDNFKKISHS